MKKWLLRIFLGFLGLLALLYAFVFVRSILPATVMDSNLKVVRANIPAEANGFNPLLEAGRHVWLPSDAGVRLGGLVSNTNWDANYANELLEKNREALAGWDTVAKLPDFQVPENFTLSDSLEYLAAWKSMSQLANVRENYLMRLGQDRAAFDQMVNQVFLGRKMQASGGVFICYLVGTAVNNMGLLQIQKWAGQSHLTPREFKEIARKLDLDSVEDGAAIANAIKVEYKVCIATLEAIRQGRMTDSETGARIPRLKGLLPVLNFSATKAMFAKEASELVRAAQQHCNEAKFSTLNDNYSGPVSAILSGNLLGKTWFYLLRPGRSAQLSKKYNSNVQLQATRAILALRAYQLTHGKLPPDLKSLVPQFLFEVPVDDFDGQPLRYSAEKKMVYSVGKNLKDDGGDDRKGDGVPPAERGLDMVCKFDF